VRAPIDIENLRLWFWSRAAVTFVVTLLLEFPFVRSALWRRPDGLEDAVLGVLLVNAVCYPLLFGWYWLASGTSLLSDVYVWCGLWNCSLRRSMCSTI
jgi:hypothetical protein